MSKWTNATLTADGQNLQAQLLDGGGFEFTKVTAADSSGTDKLTLTMQPSVIDGKTITVPVLLSNSNLSAGFTMNQLKFYARKTGIPAGDEIVYAIAEDETGDEIPSESDSPGFTIDWSYTFQFGNATSVNVSIDPAGLVSMALLGNPGGIATLNNAGAVPIEQGGTGAVTASAALAALGGMRASATGDDIPTSASDPTSISSQLSNKLSLSGGTMTAPIGLGDGGIFCGYVSGYKNEDETALYFDAIADNEDRLRLEVVIGNQGFDDHHKIRLGRYLQSDGSWKSVCDIATATPPEEYDLPLAEGITALQPCTYYKNQFGEVTVGGSVAGTISQDIIIGTLPVGYRPSKVIERPATIGTGSTRYPGTIFINPYGVITITTPAAEMAAVFEASFIAED